MKKYKINQNANRRNTKIILIIFKEEIKIDKKIKLLPVYLIVGKDNIWEQKICLNFYNFIQQENKFQLLFMKLEAI